MQRMESSLMSGKCWMIEPDDGYDPDDDDRPFDDDVDDPIYDNGDDFRPYG